MVTIAAAGMIRRMDGFLSAALCGVRPAYWIGTIPTLKRRLLRREERAPCAIKNGAPVDNALRTNGDACAAATAYLVGVGKGCPCLSRVRHRRNRRRRRQPNRRRVQRHHANDQGVPRRSNAGSSRSQERYPPSKHLDAQQETDALERLVSCLEVHLIAPPGSLGVLGQVVSHIFWGDLNAVLDFA